MRKQILSIAYMVVVFCFSACAFSPTAKLVKKAEERLNLSLSKLSLEEGWSTHGGFHGDGEMFLKFSIPDGFEENIYVKSGWQSMPLTGEVYTYYYEWGGAFEHPETNEKVIPEIQNGYWWYAVDGPQNWTFAAIDVDNNVFYYYEYDA